MTLSPPPPTQDPAPAARVYPVPPPPPVPTSMASARLVTVHAVNWHNVLDFTQIFRGFRLAINPAKILLALFAILLIYSAGRLFDAVWGRQVYYREIETFNTLPYDQFRAQRSTALETRTDRLEDLLGDAAAVPETGLSRERVMQLREDPSGAFNVLKKFYRAEFDKDMVRIHERRLVQDKAAVEAARDPSLRITTHGQTPAEQEQQSRAAAAKSLLDKVHGAQVTAGEGIFDSFMQFEISQFDQLVENTLTFVRVSAVRPSNAAPNTNPGAAVSGGLISRDPERLWHSDTVAGCIANMTITAPRWLFTGAAPMQWRPQNVDTWGGWIKMILYRGMYLLCLAAFTLFSLLILAFTGASISRLSALELSGVERAPLTEVFVFAFRRLWIFVKTPLAPLVIVLVIGLVVGCFGLVGAIPGIGPLIMGVFFFVFLAISFVVMLLLLGILGGFNLLYPTVAVEGSDAFDAMSRAFAYVYARPWRLFFYTVTSLIYGVITFLFFSFAIYLLLILTHTFVGWGTNAFGANYGAYSGLPKMETLWPTPHFTQLVAQINWYAMSWPEYIGALFLHFWVFLLITCIGAYVLSYYFSSHTIIYLLLRRSVDGQDIHVVYTDPPPAAPSPSAALVEIPASAGAPVEDPPTPATTPVPPA